MNDKELNKIADDIEEYFESGELYMAYKYAALYVQIYKYWYGR